MKRHDDKFIDIYNLIQIPWERRRIILYLFLASIITTALVSLMLTHTYRAATSIMPESGKSSILFTLSDAPGIGGMPFGNNDEDTKKIIAVLKSRTLRERLIIKLDLLKILLNRKSDDKHAMDIAVSKLRNMMYIDSNKNTGLITIAAEHEKPELARDIANSSVEILQRILNEQYLAVNNSKRDFLEDQIKEISVRLNNHQRMLAEFQKKSRMLEPKERAKIAMDLYANLISEKTALEVRMQSIRGVVSSDYPLLRSMKNQIGILNDKIQKIEGKGGINALLSMESAPDKIIEYTDLSRNVEISKSIYESLLKLYEKTKLEDTHNSLFVQVIDPAVIPYTNERPNKKLMVAVAGFTSLFFGVLLAFFLEWLNDFKKYIREK